MKNEYYDKEFFDRYAQMSRSREGLSGVLCAGFSIEALEEAEPPEEMMELPGMADEMRRPMMLMIKAGKTAQKASGEGQQPE